MSKRHGIVLFVIGLVVAVVGGIVAGAMLASSPTPYVTATLYGNAPVPVGITNDVTGDIICDPATTQAVNVDPNTRGLRSVDDEGQTVSVVAWPNKQKQIVLELTRNSDTGTVWSYRAIIARNDTGVTGVGGLEPIGVISQRVQIEISIGTNRPLPTNLTLCRLTEGVG